MELIVTKGQETIIMILYVYVTLQPVKRLFTFIVMKSISSQMYQEVNQIVFRLLFQLTESIFWSYVKFQGKIITAQRIDRDNDVYITNKKDILIFQIRANRKDLACSFLVNSSIYTVALALFPLLIEKIHIAQYS